MSGQNGFDFSGSSQGFNVLAEYLFGKNTASDKMEMTTPVITRKAQSNGEKMEMTTPVITKQEGGDKWKMSFVMPSKYGANLPLPKDPSVRIQEVPRKIVAVAAFSGFVTDEDVKRRESKLRSAMRSDTQFQVKEGALVEVAQYNPPFTLPFTRRNEIALEVEMRQDQVCIVGDAVKKVIFGYFPNPPNRVKRMDWVKFDGWVKNEGGVKFSSICGSWSDYARNSIRSCEGCRNASMRLINFDKVIKLDDD
ncbi:Soul heme-binding family protein [Thalictrum thalictroides]|uniref:Soul heme-binding family protein n=1 Tax=Thalictrum thalictroides TaxID=46969 RepID=A0A7J6V6N6_THATH|nr:Soul heme-binding family protein [Thalictrum thalictroides]